MARTGKSHLTLVRDAITEMVRSKCESSPRAWTAAEYRNLCELEQALLAIEGAMADAPGGGGRRSRARRLKVV